VVDAAGKPIAGATVTVGYNRDVTRGDGKFSVPGCTPAKQRIAASAPGFASARVDVDLGNVTNPIRFVLRPGKVLRIRVVDDQGNPLTNATIHSLSPQIIFTAGQVTSWEQPDPDSKQVDYEGAAEWTDAPDSEVNFLVFLLDGQSAIETIRPDGHEHIITIKTATQRRRRD
jgi:hypothetical protein